MEVDFSRLTRDYRTNRLKRGEMIPKQDLQYLFIEANLTLKQMAKIINRHPNQIGRQCKENHVIKDKYVRPPVEIQLPEISNIQNLFLQKFPDVIMDYKEDPLVWDYYIPSQKLYISYNVGEEHGGEPFNPSNVQHWSKVKNWADKAQNMETNEDKNHYANLINTWTILDVLKRNTAQHNNLNYKEFFTEEEFKKWYYS